MMSTCELLGNGTKDGEWVQEMTKDQNRTQESVLDPWPEPP